MSSRTLLSVITARFLGPGNLGVFSLISWVTGIADLFLNLGIAFGVTKYVAELEGKKDRETIGAFINFALIVKTSAICLTAFVLIVFSGKIAGFFDRPEAAGLFIMGFLAIVPGTIGGVFSSALVGVQRYQYSLRINLVFVPLSFMASLLVLLKGYGVMGLLVVNLVIATVRMLANFSAAASERLLNKKISVPKELLRKSIRFNVGVTIMDVLDMIVWQRSEVIFLGKFRAIQEVGFYSLAYGFTNMTVTFVSSAISSVLIPIQSQAYGENNPARMKRIYYKSLKYISMVSFPVAAGGIALAEPLIRILYGPKYLPVASILSLLFLSSAGARVGSSFASLMYSAGLVGVKVKFAIGYAILNILLDFLLIPKYGIWGAAIANSSTQLLGIFIGPFVIYYFFRFEFPIAMLSRILFSCGFMGGALYLIRLLVGIHNFPMLLAMVLFGSVAYGFGLIIFGALDREDVRLMKDVYEKFPSPLKGPYVALLYKLENYVDGRSRRVSEY
jgi:O-antigen/teichoic acid export membrane protein